MNLLLNPIEDEVAPGKLSILSVNDLAHRLRLSRAFIESVADHAGRFYAPFEKQSKVRWFPKKATPPKHREIDNPNGDLKRIQARIQRNLLKGLVVPHYLCGGVKGRSIIDNVSMHVGARVLVTIDIKSFYPSIRPEQVYAVWNDLLACSPPVSALLTRLTTFRRRLPQGAPTSSLLANLVLYKSDELIRTECAAQNITYTTWVDDLAFSGQNAPRIIGVVVAALKDNGFGISHKKVRIFGSGGRKILNGILVGRFPGVLKERLNQIRSGIHKLESGEVNLADMEKYCQSIEGSINHLKNLVPRQGSKLRSQFESALRSLEARTVASPSPVNGTINQMSSGMMKKAKKSISLVV